jgi:hypothetical protein
MWWNVPQDLLEHIDGKWSALRRANQKADEQAM